MLERSVNVPPNHIVHTNAGCRWPVWQPIVAVLLLSLVIRSYDIDRKVSALFYNAEKHEWTYERAEPLRSFYDYGTYPPLMLGIAGGLVFLFGQRMWPKIGKHRLNSLRRDGLFLALLLLIGPGLIVNGGFKSWWGRPRPVLCEDFGGKMMFKQVGEWAKPFPNSSFPSGHASIAFFLMGPAFLFKSNQERRRRSWLIAGIVFGFAMGFTRVLQGGHFLSDIVWAGLIVYLVGVALAYQMFRFDNEIGND